MKTSYTRSNRIVTAKTPKCQATQLPRFRDRHQAIASKQAQERQSRNTQLLAFTCTAPHVTSMNWLCCRATTRSPNSSKVPRTRASRPM